MIFILKVITFPYVIYWAFLKHPDEPWRWVWKAYWDNCRVWICILAVAVSGFIGIELGNVLKLELDTLDKWGEEEYIKRDSLRQDKARMETYDMSKELHDGSAE